MAVALHVGPAPANEDDLLKFAAYNPHLRVELSALGELIVSPPAGGWSVHCKDEILVQIHRWNAGAHYGMAFGAQGTFRLPNGAVLVPDVSLVEQRRYAALSAREQEGIMPLCPDLVVEVKSPADDICDLTRKLADFRANGAGVTILFDPAGHVEVWDLHGERILRSPDDIEVHIPGCAEPLIVELRALYRPPA